LRKPTDFYQLKNKEPELGKLGGLKKKLLTNIFNSVEKSKKKSLASLLTALGIPLLSSVKAKKLTSYYPNLTSLFAVIENNDWEKIREILGEETQKSLTNYFQNPENINLVQALGQISNFSGN
jgi:NAD-dependent DNA ligase